MASESRLAILLRQNLRVMLGDPDREVEIASLVSLASGDPFLRSIIDSELAPRNGHLDLHLGGDSVQAHKTLAAPFGAFVMDFAASVKATMRGIAGLNSARDELLIEPGPGSVRAVFIAPLRPNGQRLDLQEGLDEILVEEDAYSESLRRHAVLLAAMNEVEIDSPEADAAIAAIPTAARSKLRKALDEVVTAGWEIKGRFEQRGIAPTTLELLPAEARYLRDRLVAVKTKSEVWTTTGVLDGHTWSTNMMRFIPFDRSRPITATFESASVQARVARLDAAPEQKVQATFTVTTTHSEANPSGRRTYSLTSVAAVPESPTLNGMGLPPG